MWRDITEEELDELTGTGRYQLVAEDDAVTADHGQVGGCLALVEKCHIQIGCHSVRFYSVNIETFFGLIGTRKCMYPDSGNENTSLHICRIAIRSVRDH